MKHLVKPECKFGCRFIQITRTLWLCPHAAYGWASNLKGAVAEARQVLERSGGYEEVLKRVVAAEEDKLEKRRQWRRKTIQRLADQVTYDE